MLDELDAIHLGPCDAEHVGAEVEAGDLGFWKLPTETQKVPSGAAADFENAARADEAGGTLDDGIASEEEAPAGGVVDAGVESVVALKCFVGRSGGIHGRISAKWVLP